MNKFKTLIYIMLLSGGFVFMNACNKATVPGVSFDFTGADAKFTVPPSHSKGTVSLGTVTTKAALDSIKNANGASALTVKSLVIKQATFTITAPQGQTFDAYDQLNLYISATGITETKLAYINPVPKGQTSISLTVQSTDITQFFKQSYVSLRADGTTNDSIPNPVSMTLAAKYTVTAQ